MLKKIIYAITAAVALVLGYFAIDQWKGYVEETRFAVPVGYAASLAHENASSYVVAPGFVEPVTKELRLGFDMSGVISALLVKEGQSVRKGQALAMLRQDEYQASVAEAQARFGEAVSDYEMHTNGSRPEEREKAVEELKRAEIRLAQAENELDRRKAMIRSKSIGIEELERAERDFNICTYELGIAKQQFAQVHDGFRYEEVAKSQKRMEAAEAALHYAQATMDRSILRSPIDGTVLRIFSDPGEAYSIFEPSPILSVGDVSTLNVRAEVDERDVAKVRAGNKAFIAADAFSGSKYPGKVTRLELSMTPKKTRTGDPSEPVDRSVLEVLVTLDQPGPFISGMRVDVYIEESTQNAPVQRAQPASAPSVPVTPPQEPTHRQPVESVQ